MSLSGKSKELTNHCASYLRSIIRIPSMSGGEKEVVLRIVQEMERLGFDRAWVDDYGNAIGQVGYGPIRLVYDAHIDTVDVGNPESWSFDPFEGKVENGYIYGRGASDNKGSHVVQVYGAHLLKKENPELLQKFSIFVVGSIQEEDCDGLGLKFALEHSIGKVDLVCIGEATRLDLYRGHRGRMEITVFAKGKSCHGSAPERGINAIYKMNNLVSDIEKLNRALQGDVFLGKGTCTVTHISCRTPSLCAVPDACSIHIDRRLTKGENQELAISQIKNLPGFDKSSMEVSTLTYDTPSYRGKLLTTEKYYPTWVLEEKHPFIQSGIAAAFEARGSRPSVGRWVFSTNGVSSMGQLGIPSLGFGPGNEEDAHTVNDRVKIDELPVAIAFYSLLPQFIQFNPHEDLK